MRITLHIGLEKTGTSSLQSFLFRNRDALAARGVLVPVSAGQGVHHEVLLAAMDDDNIDNIRVIRRRVEPERLSALRLRFADQLADEIATRKPNHLILTDERLSSRLFRPSETRRLSNFLRQFSSDVRVLVYLREQADLLPSSWATSVIYGDTAPLRLEVPERGESPAAAWRRRRAAQLATKPDSAYVFDPLPFWFDFKEVLELWSKGFGSAAVIPRLYSRTALLQNDIVADFAASVELGPIDSLVRTGRKNAAPSILAIRAMRAYNLLYPPIIGQKRNMRRRMGVIRLLQRIPGPRPRLSPHEQTKIGTLFADSNAEVARDWFGSEEPLFKR